MSTFSTFGTCARDLCQRSYSRVKEYGPIAMRKFGDNMAAPFWVLGSLSQGHYNIQKYGFSASNLVTRPLIASGFDIVGSLVMFFDGHTDRGNRNGCMLGLIGSTATLWPYLEKKELIGTYFLLNAPKVAGIFSRSLTKTFEESKYFVLRQTLGRPRITGLINATMCGRVALKNTEINGWHVFPLKTAHPELAVPYAIWTLAFVIASASRSEASKLRQKRSAQNNRASIPSIIANGRHPG